MINHAALDIIRIGIRRRFAQAKLNVAPGRVDIYEDILNALAVDVEVLITAEHQRPLTVEYPLNWCEHLRQAVYQWMDRKPFFHKLPLFLHNWLGHYVAKHPVKKTVRRFDVSTLYPHLQTKLPAELIGPTFTILIRDKGSDMEHYLSCVTEAAMSLIEWNAKVKPFTRFRNGKYICPTCRRPDITYEY